MVIQNDRSQFAKNFFATALSKPPCGDGHLSVRWGTLRETLCPIKFKNHVENLEIGRLQVIELVFKAPQ